MMIIISFSTGVQCTEDAAEEETLHRVRSSKSLLSGGRSPQESPGRSTGSRESSQLSHAYPL